MKSILALILLLLFTVTDSNKTSENQLDASSTEQSCGTNDHGGGAYG